MSSTDIWKARRSLGKELSGTENRLELRLLFVEKWSFEKNAKILPIFRLLGVLSKLINYVI